MQITVKIANFKLAHKAALRAYCSIYVRAIFSSLGV